MLRSSIQQYKCCGALNNISVLDSTKRLVSYSMERQWRHVRVRPLYEFGEILHMECFCSNKVKIFSFQFVPAAVSFLRGWNICDEGTERGNKSNFFDRVHPISQLSFWVCLNNLLFACSRFVIDEWSHEDLCLQKNYSAGISISLSFVHRKVNKLFSSLGFAIKSGERLLRLLMRYTHYLL